MKLKHIYSVTFRTDETKEHALLVLLRQNGTSIDEFFKNILHIVSLLNTLAAASSLSVEAKQSTIQSNQRTGLRSFIDGSRDPLWNILNARQPHNLAKAFEIAVDKQRDRPELFNYASRNYYKFREGSQMNHNNRYFNRHFDKNIIKKTIIIIMV